MKKFNIFFPSPYKIGNPYIRYKYKVFLKLIKLYNFENEFIACYNSVRKYESPILFFNNYENASRGYFNKLTAWISLPYSYRQTLRKLETINTFLNNVGLLFPYGKEYTSNIDLLPRLISNYIPNKYYTNPLEAANKIIQFKQKPKEYLENMSLNGIIDFFGFDRSEAGE